MGRRPDFLSQVSAYCPELGVAKACMLPRDQGKDLCAEDHFSGPDFTKGTPCRPLRNRTAVPRTKELATTSCTCPVTQWDDTVNDGPQAGTTCFWKPAPCGDSPYFPP